MKFLLIAATAAFALTGCNPKPTATEKFHVAKHKVYHFDDGRVGYQDQDTLIWYYLIANPGQNPTATGSLRDSGNSPTIVGGWTRGDAPKESELAEAEAQDQGIVEDGAGEPADAAEAAAVEASDPDLASASPDAAAAAGEISATVEFSTQAEGHVGEAATDTGSTDTGSSDMGSSDAGGGDGGGGGGE